MSQPKPIQLVLQGGGAKIFALIAAMDALHSAVQQGKVEITRIAGTSAGAIVGSLYAAGINPQTIRKAFESFPLDRLVRFERSWHKGAALLRLLRSIPLADDRALASMLDDLLRTEIRPGGGPIRLKDLKTPMLIVASDVSGRERIVYDSQREGQDRNLVTCILDSCAIPFFFRAAGKDSQTLILDGGLCENLASELLVPGAGRHGDVVAISFIDEAPSTPRSPLELAGALLDTAISAAVRRSKLAGNLFLIELNPFGIGTFDFAEARRALQAGRESSRYENARQKTEQMIEELCAAQGRRRVSKNRWDSADPVTMGQLLKIYRSQQLPRTFRYLLRRLTIEANSLLQEGEEDYGTRDLVVSTIQFAPSKEPIDSLVAQISLDPGERPSDVTCDVYDAEGNPVPFQPVPVRDSDNDRIYGLLICFTPPLLPAPGTSYVLRAEFRVGQAFADLKKGSVDFMESTILRSEGPVDKVELVAHIPRSFGKVQIASGPSPSHPAQPMSPHELPALQGRGQFQVYGWRAEGVPNEGTARIDLRKV